MKYDLCDFSVKELRMLTMAVYDLIDKKVGRLATCEIFPDGDVRDQLESNANNGLAELREMNVRILTALDIVKNREKIQSN